MVATHATLVGLTFTRTSLRAGWITLAQATSSRCSKFSAVVVGVFAEVVVSVLVGDPRDSADRADMIARSPLFRADSARAPLLIFQGANDPRVTKTQADQIARAWHRRGIPVTYLLASNEGHGWGEAETALAVNRATEQFLGRCLGGRVQGTVSPTVEAALKAMLVDASSM